MITLEDLVEENHSYRKFKKIWKKVESNNNYKGYGIFRLFKCLLLQFLEDLSDRELEKYLKENTSAKWFCDFSIKASTPHYTLFTKIRAKTGANLWKEKDS